MSEQRIDQAAEAQLLMDLSRQWSEIVSSGDLETALDFWADDAVMMPPDSPILSGKAAIREFVTSAAEVPGFKISWEPESVQVSKDGDMAYMIERNVTEFDGEDGHKTIVHGKVVTIWRKATDGQWRNVIDIWNSAPPPND